MSLEWVNLIWVILGGIISFIILIIKNSYTAGKLSEELVTKKEVESKINLLRSEMNLKFSEVDDVIERKIENINIKLNSMNDILVKQEARETEKCKYEKEMKQSDKDSLERVCSMMIELNKKLDNQQSLVIKHESVLNDRRKDSFVQN